MVRDLLTKDKIFAKAKRKYNDFLKSEILDENDFFPLEIIGNKGRYNDENQFDLFSNDFNSLGYGYMIKKITKDKRFVGEQDEIKKIYFNDKENYLKFLNLENDYLNLILNINLLISTFPELKEYILKKIPYFRENYNKIRKIILVLNYFKHNPKPNKYIRELDIDIDTKFIEDNKTIINNLLEIIIPNDINYNEEEFEEKFNLKSKDSFIRIRILDKNINKLNGIHNSFNDFQLSIENINSLNLKCKNIFIVENEITFLTFPNLNDSIVIFGSGYAAKRLNKINWLSEKDIYYWGDLDSHGFDILNTIRKDLPNIVSIMMDRRTFDEFYSKEVSPEIYRNEMNYLNSDEKELFNFLKANKYRLEQEKIPNKYVFDFLEKRFN